MTNQVIYNIYTLNHLLLLCQINKKVKFERKTEQWARAISEH
jgi:hypothetical protein